MDVRSTRYRDSNDFNRLPNTENVDFVKRIRGYVKRMVLWTTFAHSKSSKINRFIRITRGRYTCFDTK